jgi:hypothetical protein
MEWVRERDLLIAQTLEFVRSVDSKIAGGKSGAESDARPRMELGSIDAAKLVEPPASIQVDIQASIPPAPPPIIFGDIRAEIQSRIAIFRAHQERFQRERRAYYAATMARVRQED